MFGNWPAQRVLPDDNVLDCMVIDMWFNTTTRGLDLG
jgi:hypothetical protein